MCGIAGIIGPGAASRRSALERMMPALRHRGPDGEGVYTAPSGNCVLGHRRLSILDLSDAAAQPMVAKGGRFALSYNGEIYNYRELREAAGGGAPRSSGDTEVLLDLLAREGADCIERLNGMFAFALWDDAAQRLLLARDAWGQKPLFFAQAGELLVFASEMRALLASGLVAPELNLNSALSFLSYGWTQEPATMLQGVQALPAGHSALLAAPGGELRQRDHRPPRPQGRPCGPEELRELFRRAVGRTLVSDAPLGVFLSGGIDSSALVAGATMASERLPLHTLTVTFPDLPGQSEAAFAREVSCLWHSRHHEVPISGDEMLRMLPQAIRAMDHPSMDGINTFLVAHGAAQAGLKAVLSGVGGDELFGGYPLFGDLPRLLRWRERIHPLAPGLAAAIGAFPLWDRRLAKLQDFLAAPRGLCHQYFVRRQVFSGRQLKALAPSVFAPGARPYLDPGRMGSLEGAAAGSALQDSIAAMEQQFYMGRLLLRDMDIMGMAHGVEIRSPFLDQEFSGRVCAMGPETRSPGRFPKHVFVEAMDDWLPESCRRPKQGFALPFERWMLNELKAEVTAGLDSLGRRVGWFDSGAIDSLWRTFQREPARVGWARPWMLFVLGRYLDNLHMAAS